jgi:hypothetical protein
MFSKIFSCTAILSLTLAASAQQVGQSTSTPGPAPLGSTSTITVIPGGQQDNGKVPVKVKEYTPGVALYDGPVRPFSKIGVAIKITTLGPGFDIATPLSRSLNLRGSADFFSFGHDFTTDGITYNASLDFRGGAVNVDWFPFHNGFHVSPGVYFLKSTLGGTLFVPAGQTFTLNDVDYTSSAADPIHGNGSLVFPHTAGPSLTVGWGNIIPRSGKHWSVPFEIGVAYFGQPAVALNLAGIACQGVNCSSVATDPDTQANVKAEQNTLNDDLKALQVYPIVSLGVSYKF